jgi:hypothetical protein
MADNLKKVTELPEDVAPTPDDLLLMVNAPGSAPATRKVAIQKVVALAPSSGIPATIVDAKGELIAGIGNDAVGRVPAGQNGQVLTADSMQPTGMRWTTPSAGGGGGGTVTDVIHTGPAPPTDPAIELWADTDEPAVNVGGPIDALWEGPTPPADPTYELWADTSGTAGTPISGFPFVPFTPFSTVGWTWVNQGSATVTEGSNIVYMSTPSASGENLRALTKALPAGTPTITLACLLSGARNSLQAGLLLYESATQKGLAICINAASGGLEFQVKRENSPTSFNALLTNIAWVAGPIYYLRIRVTATQYLFDVSGDGVNWIPWVTENKTAFLTAGADRIGIYMLNNSGQVGSASFLSWAES